jgi:hypothetical protein
VVDAVDSIEIAENLPRVEPAPKTSGAMCEVEETTQIEGGMNPFLQGPPRYRFRQAQLIDARRDQTGFPTVKIEVKYFGEKWV